MRNGSAAMIIFLLRASILQRPWNGMGGRISCRWVDTSGLPFVWCQSSLFRSIYRPGPASCWERRKWELGAMFLNLKDCKHNGRMRLFS